MKKIISFEKRIEFPSMIGEITSISLEHNLKFVDCNSVEGELLVSGSYKLTEASRIEESFSYQLPTDILLTESLDLDTTHIDIDDFYYEIENDYTLVCYIDIKVEGVEIVNIEEDRTEEKEEVDIIEKLDDIETLPELHDEPQKIETIEVEKDTRECDGDLENSQEETEEMEIQEMKIEESNNSNETPIVSSLFENISESEETYATYSVYILREEETINSLIEKYKTTKEELESYNDLSTLSIGSKIIIPYHAQDN